MYLTVQKIFGKSKVYGYSKDVVTTWYSVDTTKKYSWKYSDDKFERENYSYKFTVKESYRENGKVKQRQVVLGTFHWFEFIDHWLDGDIREERLIEVFPNITEEQLEEIGNEYSKRIEEIEIIEGKKWLKSVEYKAHDKHLSLIKKYESRKKYYDDYLGEGYFEQIFDVYLNVMDKTLYDQIHNIHEYKIKEDEERRKAEEEKRKKDKEYYDNYWKSYSNGNFDTGSLIGTTYSDKEKEHLKKFYRALASKYHPDVTGENDTMQFLNKLKEQWGL